MKKLLVVIFCLVAVAVAARTPIASTAEGAGQFNQLSKTVFPPVYDYLTADLVADLNLAGRSGIGIDIGGGPGDWVIRLAQAAPGMYWINTDINRHYGVYFMQTALDSAVTSSVGWVPADAVDLPFRDNYADVIISRGSFQFWPDLAAGMAEIQRVLKPGGTAFIGRGFAASMPENVAHQVREKQHGGPQYSISGTKARFENLIHEMNITNYTIIVPHPELKDVSYGIWLKFKK